VRLGTRSSRARKTHRWTEEDAAWAASQWASGIKQREIGAVFGHRFGGMVNLKIRAFLEKYGSLPSVPVYPAPWNDAAYRDAPAGEERKALVKQALAVFVAQRNLGYAEREHEELMREGREMGFVGPKARSTHEDAPEAG
jgi:hypothetical protein